MKPKLCDDCGGGGYVRVALDDVEPCSCTEGLLYALNQQRDRILLMCMRTTDEDNDEVDRIDRELIIYGSIRARLELTALAKEDEWRICSTTKIIRERIGKLEREPVL